MKHFANIQKKHHQKIFLENIHNFTIKACWSLLSIYDVVLLSALMQTGQFSKPNAHNTHNDMIAKCNQRPAAVSFHKIFAKIQHKVPCSK